MNYSHAELCHKAALYLLTTGNFPIVCQEMHSALQEIPDVYAKNRHFSVVIECKTSKADFERDKKKRFRRYPKEGLGRYRYYFCEVGLITEKDLPKKWGLIYIYPDGKMRMMKGKVFGNKKYDSEYRFSENWEAECEAMYSLLRKTVSWGFGKDGIWEYKNNSAEDSMGDSEF